jgi:hypothetical protein
MGRPRPKGSYQLALAMPVPMASSHNRPVAYTSLDKPRPLIHVTPKRSIEFHFQEFFDEAANAGPLPDFQRIELIVAKKKRSFRRNSPLPS